MLNYFRVKPWLGQRCRNVKRIPLLVLWINLQILQTLKKNDFVKMKSTYLQGLKSVCTHLTSTSKYLKSPMCWKGEKRKAFSWRDTLKKKKSHRLIFALDLYVSVSIVSLIMKKQERWLKKNLYLDTLWKLNSITNNWETWCFKELYQLLIHLKHL